MEFSMRFSLVQPPGQSIDDFERLYRHWEGRGWQRIPDRVESEVRAAWDHLPEGVHSAPSPSVTWDVFSIYALDEPGFDRAEADLTLKVLSAFRQCARSGERLFALDPLHTWYYFDPLADITTATRDDWAMPVLPNGDSYNFFASDFRFGLMADCRTQTICAFGAELVGALENEKPTALARVVNRDGVQVSWLSSRVVKRRMTRHGE